MRNYNFDEVINRRDTNSYKWDTPTDSATLPMWVADMDFPTAPCIIEALHRRVDHGIFGYTKVPAAYYRAIVDWFARRHGWTINPDHIIYTSSVVPALSASIKALSRPGDKVIVQTPAYNCFFSSIRNNECQLLANEMIYGEDGSYSIDYDDLEAKAREAKLMILCNPHNPGGRVWRRDELTRIAEICKRHDVTIIADEIHCELTFHGYEYTPFATVAEAVGTKYVIVNSPSKAFNTAGLQIANIIVPDADARAKIDRAININEVCDVNSFGLIGLMAAYNEGEPWLNDLRDYIWGNYEYARDYFAKHLNQYKVTPLEGTYLMWINIEPSGLDSEQLCRKLEEEGKVKLSPGGMYGQGGGHFLRLNLACPRSTLTEALTRLTPHLQHP